MAPKPKEVEQEPPLPDPSNIPPRIREVAAELPRRTERGQRTHGVLLDHDGNKITDEPISSGWEGPARGLPGLRTDVAWGHPVKKHVEAHVAAMMRSDRRLRHMVLVINHRPCQYERYRENACEHRLPQILPAGATLDVYVRETGKVTWYKRFTGTGEGVTGP